ncbi:MarR family winged helix-turn-helix transcriptional regulator [Metabacillus arenae]|uniref:MarR family transcriptional regulator n=1 Tax=Metabacillus arenae TaxID=2771434 RepID=A0A926NDP9_9BACI|nr:MarR family transcriptional regulator [Metabacillus arenae]MBD1381584.1 MarR family transcriptional regulator [Metabacillus arenae]
MDKREETMYEMESLLRNVFKQLRNEMNGILGKEMSRNEFLVLKILKTEGPKKSNELAKELDVSASHITAVTDSLVLKELIERIRSEEDRRMIELHLTNTGKEKLLLTEKKKTEFLFKRFDNYSNQELRELLRLFKKMYLN